MKVAAVVAKLAAAKNVNSKAEATKVPPAKGSANFKGDVKKGAANTTAAAGPEHSAAAKKVWAELLRALKTRNSAKLCDHLTRTRGRLHHR